MSPWAAAALLVGGGAYYTGVLRLWARAGRGGAVRGWQVWAFTVGLAACALAVVSPLDALAGRLLSAHMVQHLVLVLVAAPLVALGAPGLPVVWALPERLRRAAWHLRPPVEVRRGLTGVSGVGLACAAHVVTMWLWHLPAAYSAGLRFDVVHGLEHATMLGTALWLWVVALSRGGPVRRPSPAGVLGLFGAATLTVGLGALLAFAPRALYDVYEVEAMSLGVDPLADQQLAGVLMWVAGGLVYATAGAVLLGVLVARDSTPDPTGAR